MDDARFHSTFSIGAEHAALPGHFPDNAIVPGVVVLDRVASALANWRNLSIAQLVQVKFLRPLLPGQTAEIDLLDNGTNILFSVNHAGDAIASGRLEATRFDVPTAANPLPA